MSTNNPTIVTSPYAESTSNTRVQSTSTVVDTPTTSTADTRVRSTSTTVDSPYASSTTSTVSAATVDTVTNTTTSSNAATQNYYVNSIQGLVALAGQPGIFRGANINVDLVEENISNYNRINDPAGNDFEFQYKYGNGFGATGNVTYDNGNLVVTGIKTNNYMYANGLPFSGGGGNADLGNWAFTTNTMYNIYGGSILNRDLTHGSTSGLNIPANGNTSALELFNSYGSLVLIAGASGTTKSWILDSAGNITLPTNTAAINYANGTSILSGITANTGNIGFDNNNIYNTTGQGVIVSNFNFVTDEAETAYVQIPAGNSSSDLNVVQEQGNVRLVANTAVWNFGTDGKLTAPGEVYGQFFSLRGGEASGTIGSLGYGGNIIDLYGTNGVTISTVTEGGPQWQFGSTGNLTAPGNIITPTNFVGASLRTSLTDFNFVRSITNIATGATTVVTLASNTFGDPWSGQVVITDVAGATEANATWWYEAVDADQFALYTDSTLSTPVDSSAWGAYTGGGLAVTLDYNDISINAQNITIQSGTADYNNRVWTFGSDGTTIFPTLRVNLHNGGIQSGQVLQFGDNQQAIITGPTPPVDSNAERIIIQGQRGLGTGEGGDVYLWGGDSDGTNGGDIKIYAGDADGVSGTGGYVNIDGGAGAYQGGTVEITGGPSSGGNGGYVSVVGGNGNVGGGLFIQGGQGSSGAGGPVNITGGISGNSLAEYGNVAIISGESGWLFNNTGNLVLPVGGTIVGDTSFNNGHINWVGNSSGDGYGYTTMNLVPDDTVGESYLILDPTSPNHIHIRAGGAQDDSGSQLYLGGENSYFKVDNGSNPNVYVAANSYVWKFGTDGGQQLATIVTGEGTAETATIKGTRKIVGDIGAYAASSAGHTAFGNVAWTASTNLIQSAKVTFAVQTNGAAYNWEQFDVAICRLDSANAFVSVSNRIRQNSAIAYTEVGGYVNAGVLEIWLNPADGQTSALINYDAVEFNIMAD